MCVCVRTHTYIHTYIVHEYMNMNTWSTCSSKKSSMKKSFAVVFTYWSCHSKQDIHTYIHQTRVPDVHTYDIKQSSTTFKNEQNRQSYRHRCMYGRFTASKSLSKPMLMVLLSCDCNSGGRVCMPVLLAVVVFAWLLLSLWLEPPATSAKGTPPAHTYHTKTYKQHTYIYTWKNYMNNH